MNLLLLFWILLGIKSETSPEFKGGTRSLNHFISTNLIYPEFSRANCIQGTINIRFKLDRQGKISSSKIDKGMGLDLDLEALRVVRLTSGRWNVPETFDTTQSIIIPINFILREFNCASRSSDDIKEAMAAYRSTQDLTRAIVNFYQKKSSGNYTPAEETRILELKSQLGYDERFITKFLKQAQQKLKQGDREAACENFQFIQNLGSDKANGFLLKNCQK
ncbi:MAG TPA: energy transducer TonB [Pedobacter sp.]